MAVVAVHPVPIDGPWIEGFVLDRHVISSVPIGNLGEHMQFETTRSALQGRRSDSGLNQELLLRTSERRTMKPPAGDATRHTP